MPPDRSATQAAITHGAPRPLGDTLLVETGCYLHNIGVVVIDQGALAPELIAAGSFDGIDSSVQAIIDSENERVEGA